MSSRQPDRECGDRTWSRIFDAGGTEMIVRRSMALVAAVAGMAVMAAPASAAQVQHGTVLQVNRAHHVLRLVNRGHQARTLRYRGRLGKRVGIGSLVTYRLRGRSAS